MQEMREVFHQLLYLPHIEEELQVRFALLLVVIAKLIVQSSNGFQGERQTSKDFYIALQQLIF